MRRKKITNIKIELKIISRHKKSICVIFSYFATMDKHLDKTNKSQKGKLNKVN